MATVTEYFTSDQYYSPVGGGQIAGPLKRKCYKSVDITVHYWGMLVYPSIRTGGTQFVGIILSPRFKCATVME